MHLLRLPNFSMQSFLMILCSKVCFLISVSVWYSAEETLIKAVVRSGGS